MRILIFVIPVFLFSCSHTYYIVRHAERATQGPNMSSDVPLSEAGLQRARKLMDILSTRRIDEIYSTNTLRTKSTAQPTADHFQETIQVYGPRPDSSFIHLLKSKKRNVLVVGHSNTVDDVVNMLSGETNVPGDLAETEYDNLFIIKMKGKKAVFSREKF